MRFGSCLSDSIIVTEYAHQHAEAVLCARDRFQIGTTQTTPTPDISWDIMVETFSLLAETPIGQLGINHQVHVPRSERTWENIEAQLGDPQRIILLEGQHLQTLS